MQIDKIRGPLMHKHRAGDIGGLTEVIREQRPTSITNNTYNQVTNVSVVWISGLTFNVSNVVYTILGNTYHAPDVTIVLAAADVTHPRIDVIYVDIYGNVGVVTGTPGAVPVKPVLDPATQTEIATVYIPAGATQPAPDPNGGTGTIVTEKIYDENVEWVTSKIEEASTAIDFNSADLPSVGAKCIKITMNDLAAGGTWTREGLNVLLAYPAEAMVNIPNVATGFNIMTGTIYPDHKRDWIRGVNRVLGWVVIQNKNLIQATVTHNGTQVVYPVTISNYLRDFWAVADLGFSTNVPGMISFTSKINLPQGNYTLRVSGFNYNEQIYSSSAVVTYTPAGTLAKFTRAAGVIDAKGGNLSLDLRTNKAFLPNSGFIIDLFNGLVKVASRALVPGVNMYGFNGAILDTWQRLTIPISDFLPVSTLVTVLTIRPINEYPNNITLGVDNIILQTGAQVPAPAEANPLVYSTDWDFNDIVKDTVQTYYPDIKAAFDYKILSLVLWSDSTMDAVALKINGTAITGLSAINVTAAIAETAATGLNIVKKGDQVSLVTSGTDGTPTILRGKFTYIRI